MGPEDGRSDPGVNRGAVSWRQPDRSETMARSFRYSYMLIDSAPVLDGDPAGFFAFLRGCGYEGVELDLTPALGSRLDVLEQALADSGLTAPSFLTGSAYGPDACLSAADAGRRRRAVDHLLGALDVAERFGALLVVGLLQGLRRDEPDEALASQRIADGLRQVAEAAAARGLDLVVEPVNHLQVGFNHSVAEVRALIPAVGSSAIHPMVGGGPPRSV